MDRQLPAGFYWIRVDGADPVIAELSVDLDPVGAWLLTGCAEPMAFDDVTVVSGRLQWAPPVPVRRLTVMDSAGRAPVGRG